MKKLTSETIVKNQVRSYLRAKGWYVVNIVQNAFSTPGLSDMFAVKNAQVIFIECKGEKGKQSEHQKRFQSNLEAAGGKYLLVQGYEDLKNMGY